jgi:hypothetical protein
MVSLSAATLALVLAAAVHDGHGKTKASSSSKHPRGAMPAASESANPGDAPVFLFVKGSGILRWQDGVLSSVLHTTTAIRDLQLDAEGALWASLEEVGVVRFVGGKQVNLNKESFAKLAIRSPTDVWTVNDSHGSVVHYDGSRWKTVRTRNSLAGALDDNHLVDIASDGRVVWIASWNGLWRVTGPRWTRMEPPPGLSGGAADVDLAAVPAYPLSLVASPRGLIACYLQGCFSATDSGWKPTPWPAGKARLQRVGATDLATGIAADGRTIMVEHLDGSGETATSEPLPATGINDIAVDASGRVWAATDHSLTVFDASGRTLKEWQSGSLDGVTGEIQRVVVAGAGPTRLPDVLTAAQVQPPADLREP